MKSVFKINTPGVDNTNEILERIEKQLIARNYDPDDIEKIKNLNFTPISPGVGHGFDPAITSELFERSVATPDFTSKKFRFLKGPLRWFAARFFRMLSLINDKLAENKIQAFYNVVHELIAMNHRVNKLQLQFNSVLQENLKIRNKLHEKILSGHKSEMDPILFLTENIPTSASLKSFQNQGGIKALTNKIRLNERDILFCMDDLWGNAAAELREYGNYRIILNTAEYLQYLYLQREKNFTVLYGAADMSLAEQEENSLSLITHFDIGNASFSPDILPFLAFQKLKAGGHIMLRWVASFNNDVFKKIVKYNAEREQVMEIFSASKFTPIYEKKLLQYDQDSFELIFQKPEK